MAPTTIPGVMPLNGNMNPVTLVSTVVSRNSAVQTGRDLPAIIPMTTTKPVTIAMRLIATCNSVKVSSDMPRIMILPSPNADEPRQVRRS